jgi:hypothetical protein
VELCGRGLIQERGASAMEFACAAVVDIANERIGQLATMDQMLDQVVGSLKSSVRLQLQQITNGRENSLAVRLLKLIFIFDRLPEFDCTPENLALLVYDRVGQDLSVLADQVDQALRLLQDRGNLRRIGESYAYSPAPEEIS